MCRETRYSFEEFPSPQLPICSYNALIVTSAFMAMDAEQKLMTSGQGMVSGAVGGWGGGEMKPHSVKLQNNRKGETKHCQEAPLQGTAFKEALSAPLLVALSMRVLDCGHGDKGRQKAV